jgi:hypothetical protein
MLLKFFIISLILFDSKLSESNKCPEGFVGDNCEIGDNFDLIKQ